MERKPFAIYGITKHGINIARKLEQSLEGADVFTLEKFAPVTPTHWTALAQPFSKAIGAMWTLYDCHLFIISVGAVVRMIAPYLKDKKVDPAVLCIDDRTNFTISLLSGHVGKANLYTERVASLLQNQAVITTASDVQGTLTVDILGREFGWSLADPHHNVTSACAAVVNEQDVAIHQEIGEGHFWPHDKPWPKGVSYFPGPFKADHQSPWMNIIISDRCHTTIPPGIYERSIVFHPKSLVVGIGCDKDTPFATLWTGLQGFFKEYHLSLDSIKTISSLDIKTKEDGVQTLARHLKVELSGYSASQLDECPGVKNPSSLVKKYVGTNSVAEAAALKESKSSTLLVEKQRFFDPKTGKNMTLAVCRRSFKERPQP